MIPDVHNETRSFFFSAEMHSFVPYNALNFALAIVCGLPRVDLSHRESSHLSSTNITRVFLQIRKQEMFCPILILKMMIMLTQMENKQL
jgi:hypothetical protein